jgi:hypothetical protein
MQDLFAAWEKLRPTLRPDRSYLHYYRAISEYFVSVQTFDTDSFIVAAHVVYGWMPGVLELAVDEPVDLQRAASALNRSRMEFFNDEDLEHLIRVMNNSLVGVSKLLHFASPEIFAIWEPNVYRFVIEKRPFHYRMNSTREFADYHAKLKGLREDTQFPSFHSSVNQVVGYQVTALRALELAIFYCSRGNR